MVLRLAISFRDVGLGARQTIFVYARSLMLAAVLSVHLLPAVDQIIFPVFLLLKCCSNISSVNIVAFADTWAERGHFFRPHFRIHNFRPERPGSTLDGPCFVDAAAFVREKAAVFFDRNIIVIF